MHTVIPPTDVDSTLLSSAFLVLLGITPDEMLDITAPDGYNVVRRQGQLIVTAPDVMAPVGEFVNTLRTATYTNTRQT